MLCPTNTAGLYAKPILSPRRYVSDVKLDDGLTFLAATPVPVFELNPVGARESPIKSNLYMDTIDVLHYDTPCSQNDSVIWPMCVGALNSQCLVNAGDHNLTSVLSLTSPAGDIGADPLASSCFAWPGVIARMNSFGQGIYLYILNGGWPGYNFGWERPMMQSIDVDGATIGSQEKSLV